jgi:hypothetical protein
MVRAVITADLVGSSEYTEGDWMTINSKIQNFIHKWNKEEHTEYFAYRGDSLQGLLKDISQALNHAVYLKAYIKSAELYASKRASMADIRISIGIGEIKYRGESIKQSNGPAFQNSGRTLDRLSKKGQTIALTTPDEEMNKEWDVIMTLLEELMERWTIASAEVVWRILEGKEDVEIAEELEISRSAVSQRKKQAGWDAILKTINYYQFRFNQETYGNLS